MHYASVFHCGKQNRQKAWGRKSCKMRGFFQGGRKVPTFRRIPRGNVNIILIFEPQKPKPNFLQKTG